MIDPKELRIGNLVNTQDGHGVVRAVNLFIATVDVMNCVSEFTDDALSPIPITPEWLERLGFVNRQNEFDEWGIKIFDDPHRPNSYFYTGWFVIYAEYKDQIIDHFVCNMGDYRNETDAKFKYVHQLQNLFYCLTGQELTVKELEPKA